MTVRAPDWLDLPSVPESRLDAGTRARLAAGEGGPPAPPPWTTTVSAVLWWHRAAPGAVEHLPEAVRGLPHLPITVGALVRYRDSPVGSYSEVFASPVLLRRGFGLPAVTVPFIAVDSLASVVGGRAGWMLPKTLARALWPSDGPARVETDDWSVAVSVAPDGPRLPIRGRLPLLQAQPDRVDGPQRRGHAVDEGARDQRHALRIELQHGLIGVAGMGRLAPPHPVVVLGRVVEPVATGVDLVTNIDEAIAASMARCGDSAVAIIPEGPYVIPYYEAA